MSIIMGSRRVAVDTDRRKGMLFRIGEHGETFYVYRLKVGFLFDDSTKIGEARSLEDAIAIIKSSVPGTVRNVRIGSW